MSSKQRLRLLLVSLSCVFIWSVLYLHRLAVLQFVSLLMVAKES